MTAMQTTTRERISAGVPVAIVHALLAFAFLRSLGLELPAPPAVLRLIDLAAPPAPVAPRPQARERSRRAEGAASPPNLESRRTEIVAPPPVLPPPPPPVVTASVKDLGADPSAGAANVAGPGSGSGGQGEGTGSGRWGNGPGGGGDGDGGGGAMTPPRRIRGSIRDGDYPRGAGEAGVGGTVSVIYTVETDGRATNCMITESSGSDELDAHTCRLIEQRFRFRPSHDSAGRPVRSRIVQDHSWEVADEPRTEEPVRRRRGFRLF